MELKSAINIRQVIKLEPNQQETEPKARFFLRCSDKYHFPALA